MQKWLFFIAFLVSLAGIFILWTISENIDFEKNIAEINRERLDELVKVRGRIVKISNVGNTTFLEIEQPNRINVVVFDNVELIENENIEIIGRTEEYNGEMEIIAQRIRIIG